MSERKKGLKLVNDKAGYFSIPFTLEINQGQEMLNH